MALVSALFLSFSGVVSAAECVVHVTRTACPGQEKESFSKCKGAASCDEKQTATDAADCASKALAACKNTRLQITKYKKITADFGGAPVESGKDFCVGHPDFPYANKADCKG
jgi:hypothetical protein